MNSVPQVRKLLLAIVVVFLIVDIVAAVVLLSPAGRSPSERSKEYEQLRMERQQKEAETRPTKDMDKKLVTAKEALNEFFADRLPSSYSEMSDYLGKTASAHQVTLSNVRYDTKPSGLNGLTAVSITVDMTGGYTSEMNFINALEREKKFYVLNRLAIGDTGGNNQLRVELQLETYLRTAA